MMIARLLAILTFVALPLFGQQVRHVNNVDDPLLSHCRAKIPVIPMDPKAPEVSLYQRPIPRWVAILSLPALPRKGNEDVQMLLVEKQINVDNETTYHRVVKRVLTRNGVHNHSVVALTYNPAFQTVTLHTMCLHRQGHKIDHAPTATFHLVEAQDDDPDTFGGRNWSLITLLEDVREGDVIEYSYSAEGHNPTFMEQTIDECAFQYPYPVERIYYRVMGAAPCRVNLKAHHTRLQPERQELSNDQWEWVWNATHVPAYQQEDHQPSWYHTAPWVQISEFQDWNDVARWGAGLYGTPKKVPAMMATLVDAWEEQYPSQAERSLAALRFVQDDIKLIANDTSELHYPTDLSIIMKRRKADSVDKAYLYKTFLEMMNITATPAAVSTKNRHVIADWLPSPLAFDRVIVRIKGDDATYWVDPSLSQQGGGLVSNACGVYKRALLLDPSVRELVCLGCSLDKPEVVAATTYYLWPDQLDSTILVETTVTGTTADLLRQRLHDEGLPSFSESLRQAYAHLHGEVVIVAPAQLEDDREANSIVVREHYRAKNGWEISDQGQVKSMVIRPVYIASRLPLVGQQKRQTPVALDYPTHISETLHVIAPGYRWKRDGAIGHYVSANIDCQVTSHVNDDTMTLCGDFKILKDHVTLDELADHQAVSKGILAAATLKVDLPTQHHHSWDVTNPFLVILYLSLAIGVLAVNPKDLRR